MKFFYSGYIGCEAKLNSLYDVLGYRLLAYDQFKTGQFESFYFGDDSTSFIELMVDSGSYWAWIRNDVIDPDAFIQFCRRNAAKIQYFVSLDKIPGKYVKGKPPPISKREYGISAKISWQNYLHMVQRLKPVGILPDRVVYVFHQNEPLEFLRERVEVDRIPYLGLSPTNSDDNRTSQKRAWLQKCMSVLEDGNGKLRNEMKLHAFGVSSLDLLSEFPWYSADTSAWGIQAQNGCILVPNLRDRQLDEGTQLERRWDFSKLEYMNIGHYLEKSDFWSEDPVKRRSFRRIVFTYAKSLGLRVGHSRFRRLPSSVGRGDLLPGEKFLPKKRSRSREKQKSGRATPGIQWTEKIIIPGLMHSLPHRQFLNATSLNHFFAQLERKRSNPI